MATTREARIVSLAFTLWLGEGAARAQEVPAEPPIVPSGPSEWTAPPPPQQEPVDPPRDAPAAPVALEQEAEPEGAAEEDAEPEATAEPPRRVGRRVLHGFRLGYAYLARSQRRDENGRTVLERYGMRSPSSFLIGYEIFYRLVGHSWLNVLLVGNFMVSGLEQSRFFPSGNFLIGFELDQEMQVGVGINLTPDREKASHMVAALGWTPEVGSFFVPFHLFFVPDVDGNHRMGVTIGVTW